MEDPTQQGSAGSAGLRHRRKVGPADPDRTSRHDHGDLADHWDHDHDANNDGNNDDDDNDDDSVEIPADGADKKTYGRTPDGTVFTVPRTHDMVSQLLDPRQPKNLTDAAVLAILALHVLAAWALPPDLRQPVLGAVFIFWRAAYNIGIGALLRAQSNHGSLVVWARRMRLFERPDGGAGTGTGGGNPRPWLYSLLQRELEAKIPHDYEFATAPGEYNTWLVFRRLVDLILMCDFTSYCLFAVACGRTPPGEGVAMAISRWAAGLGLVGFNLWVKLDAHRVVKDFAWYWGDFFFLIDQELTFDGVFEMAPHPMYSIGYAGYYGISMMAASYQVLFISILAHVAQFAFLVLIENPHIDKIYNPPPPRKQVASRESDEDTNDDESSGAGDMIQQQIQQQQASANSPSSVHNLIGLSNLDLFRVTDYSVILLLSYLAVVTAATARSPAADAIFLAHAIAWRLWYHVGLGLILNRQSLNKMWTRHFVKYGESTNESWRQWKAMCHLSMVMCHASGLAAAWRMYAVPADWSDGAVLLKHVVGAGLVALQMWTAASIYESLGEFGWFFGDFFFEHEAKLTYTSIYRFLNNPERLFGSAAAWGAALVTRSWSVVVLAVVGHVLQLGFLAYVEKPHMQRVFGRKLRREAGLTKFIKRSLPPPVKGWQESVDRVLDDTTRLVEEFVESARPRFAAGVRTIVRDTSALFNLAPARLTITRLAPGSGDVATRDARHYRLAVSGAPLSAAAVDDRATGKESLTARCLSGSSALGGGGGSGGGPATAVFEYGAPLRVTWTAPARHDPADWIGLYMVTDNRSRDVTDVSSLGRWAPTTAGVYDVITADRSILVEEHPVLAHVPAAPSAAAAAAAVADPDLVRGEVLFSGDKLWWTQGVLELRYHHGGSHTVMAISQPFEVRVGRFDGAAAEAAAAEEEYQAAVETALLPLVQNCLDRDPDIAPSTVEERFGTHVERDGKYAKRVVYVVHQMFGVEFAPAVVPADGNVRRLAWRICNAKQVLAPYSMSKSRGAATPTESA